MGTSPADSGRDESSRLWRLAGLGGTLASEIIAGALIGLGLDYLFGTQPVLVIVFTAGGVLGGMIHFVQCARKAVESEAAQWSGRRGAETGDQRENRRSHDGAGRGGPDRDPEILEDDATH